MQRTPSPPRRVRTPPAPLHGAKYDSYEPYSPPRRSRRLNPQQPTSSSSSRLSRSARETTPTTSSSQANKSARSSLQVFSPPSSPISPNHLRSPRSTRRIHFAGDSEDSDNHIIAPTPSRRFLSMTDARSMLPTPSKTPRKRALKTEESLSSTARVLFPNRPTTVDDAMPTPRKGRKGNQNVFLQSFEQVEEETETIQIFTDSKDRIPTASEDEENPFVSKRGRGKGKAKAKSAAKRKVDEETAKMEEAVARGEGMVYLFRGKKLFRSYQDGPAHESGEDPDLSGREVRRQVGFEAQRPLTRSSVKPRLLFQEEIKKRQRALGIESDEEEAITDIEIPVATPSRRKTRKINHAEVPVEQPEAQVAQATQEAQAQTATPPPTVRKLTRQTSFQMWSRKKSANDESSSSSTRELRKRGGDSLESTSEKRTRSEQSSAMLLD